MTIAIAGNEQRAGHQRQDAERRTAWIAADQRRPGEEVDRADLGEELERLEGEDEDDAGRRDDAERRRAGTAAPR